MKIDGSRLGYGKVHWGVLSLALTLLLALPGCSQSFYYLGEPIPSDIEQRAKGITLAALLAELGPPQRLSATSTGYVMGWEYWQITEESVGISLQAVGADALSADWGDARVTGDFLLVSVDQSRRVSDLVRSSWNTDIGDAASVQAFFAVAPALDVDDLLEPLPQHDWAASLLLPMPEAQNIANRPDMGTTGIEQRGTPYGIGQKSLEFD